MDAVQRGGIRHAIVPDGFPHVWLRSVEVLREPVDAATLGGLGAVVTTCAVLIADIGTIILDAGPGMSPRALILVPDYHLVVLRRGQVLANVPDAIARLDPSRSPIWISGPSATSDIELNRGRGRARPTTLDVPIKLSVNDCPRLMS